MKKITFECQTITPMFLAGADPKKPELRPPSIKGALRFWWRAMHGDLDLKTLKEREAEIFGGTDEKAGRSKVIISRRIIKKEIKKNYISITPHHKDQYINGKKDFKALKRDASFFNFYLDIQFFENFISKNDIIKLVTATFLLGGFGKRSRRGFGSINLKFDKNFVFRDLEDIKKFISQIPKTDNNYDFPVINDIKIGKKYTNYFSLLEDIGKNTHLNKSTHNNKLQRHASPIYVSIIKPDINKKEYYPIVTELTYNSKNYYKDNNIDFKNAILQKY